MVNDGRIAQLDNGGLIILRYENGRIASVYTSGSGSLDELAAKMAGMMIKIFVPNLPPQNKLIIKALRNATQKR